MSTRGRAGGAISIRFPRHFCGSRFRGFPVVCLLLLAPALLAAARPPEPPRPNIVLLMSDDQGWGEVGYQGHSRLHTPALDAMSRAGMRFERFYAAAPICSPTRASVLTGRHPLRSGVLSRNYALRPEEFTLAAVLKSVGYRTAHFGKWHLGPVKAGSGLNPASFGFDEYLSSDRAFDIDDVFSRNGEAPFKFEGEGSEVVVYEALRFMRQAHSEGVPFFAVIWFGSPHRPNVGTAADRAPYGGGDDSLTHRFAEITALDRAIGRVRGSLRRMQAERDTIVWFCSDNGPPQRIAENGALRGRKGGLGEGGIRVPGLLEWPGVIARASVATAPAGTSDILPTLLDLLGVALPERPLDGVSLVPWITGGEQTRPPIGFWTVPTTGESGNPSWFDAESLRGMAYSLSKRPPARFYNFRHPVARTADFPGEAAWLDGPFKLRARAGGAGAPKLELFDLAIDPAEQHDVAHSHPMVVARMQQELMAWQRSVERSWTGADYRNGAEPGRTR